MNKMRGQFLYCCVGFLLQPMFNHALAAEPATIEAADKLTEKGSIELQNKDYESADSTFGEAIEAYDNLLKTAPNNAEALRNKGRTLAVMSRSTALTPRERVDLLQESLGYFSKASKVSPRDFRIYAYKGNALLTLSRLHWAGSRSSECKSYARKAIAELEKSLRIDPANSACIKDLKEAEDFAAGKPPKGVEDIMQRIKARLQAKDNNSAEPTKKIDP
jgi:tetratricopeptide (TPR) repeat protein